MGILEGIRLTLWGIIGFFGLFLSYVLLIVPFILISTLLIIPIVLFGFLLWSGGDPFIVATAETLELARTIAESFVEITNGAIALCKQNSYIVWELEVINGLLKRAGMFRILI